MSRGLKITVAILGLVAALTTAAAVFVHFYLTDEKVRELLLPPMRKAVGREITIGEIKAGLLSGIALSNVTVKEADGKADFLTIHRFVLRYRFWPLLAKKVMIKEVLVEEPQARIHRDKTGRFNFEGLSFLKQGKRATAPPPVEKPQAAAGGLPLSLTVEKVRISGARLQLSDAKGDFPLLRLKADSTIKMHLSTRGTLDIQGETSFAAQAVKGNFKGRVHGKADFTPRLLTLDATIQPGTESLKLKARVEEYLKTPQIELDIIAKRFNLDAAIADLAGMIAAPAAALASRPPATATPPSEDQPIAALLPPGLGAKGRLKVETLSYRGLVMENVDLPFRLENNIFRLEQGRLGLAGGTLAQSVEVDLNRVEPSFQGTVSVEHLGLSALASSLSSSIADSVGGGLSLALDFSGSGISWPAIRNTLNMHGTYHLSEFRLRQTPITSTAASLIGIRELQDLFFPKGEGNFRVQDGKVYFSTLLSSPDLTLEANGSVGFDTSLNLPVTLRLGPAYSEKLKQRAALARYLADDAGNTVLKLTITGTIAKPRPALDPVMIRKQAEQAIERKIVEEVGKALQKKSGEGSSSPAEQILRGILGR